jgi:hypothetical protein
MGAGHHLDRLSLALSPAAARNWCERARVMSASMCTSPASLLAPEAACRSRYRAACRGLTSYTT